MKLEPIKSQHPQLLIRGLVGHGAAADVAHAYACRYGEGNTCPTRMLAQLARSREGSAAWPNLIAP